MNGNKSSGKRSQAMNIRYFFITDQVDKVNVDIEHCSTDGMVANVMKKPLHGSTFRGFIKSIIVM